VSKEIPRSCVVVFDEAHNIGNLSIKFFDFDVI